jgi:hypothetical protein
MATGIMFVLVCWCVLGCKEPKTAVLVLYLKRGINEGRSPDGPALDKAEMREEAAGRSAARSCGCGGALQVTTGMFELVHWSVLGSLRSRRGINEEPGNTSLSSP